MKILITGITGFIGGHVCQRLMADDTHTIIGLVRPESPETRYDEFRPAIRVQSLNFTDRMAIDALFAQHQFDWVLHIAALRGGGAASRTEFDRSNIDAPIILAEAALKYGARFVFCSSVGVFGTIPQHLPPTETTPKVGDNYYHFTKIEAERRLSALQAQGLPLVIVRPIITYGIGDRGFPFLLIKLTEQGLLPLPTQDIHIHLADVRTLAEAFAQIVMTPETMGKTYTITDVAPVSLDALVNHIASRLTGRPYPGWKRFPTSLYRLAEFGFAHVIKNEAWLTRVQLMSRDWFYDGALAAHDLCLNLPATIPNFDYVIEWYQQRSKR